MMRQISAAFLFLCASVQAWAQNDTLRYRDPRKQDVTCVITELNYKQVKYSQIINGEFAGNAQDNSVEIREVVLGADHKNFDFQAAEQSMNEGNYDAAADRFEKSLKSPKSETGKQQARINMVRCYARGSSPDKAIASANDFRKEMPNSFYFAESYFLQYEACRIKGDLPGMERALTDLGKESESRGMPDWKNNAELLNAELYEMQGKYSQALPIHTKYVNDPGVGKQAKLGEMRCLSALSNWGSLKAKAEAILGAMKENKGDEQLLMGAYNARGDCLLASGKTKDALLDYMRGVLVLNASGESCREHEAAIAKAAIACAKYAGELREQDRATYKQRARDLQAELDREYPRSSWAKQVNEAIQAVK